MRPVRLEMNGFASFREHTVIDFTDADYFALVGPTGSGKSTILDAITFALYGTAYRWGAENAVADALAPSTNRCTVSLTFDAGPHRYQVAREVRRSGQQVQQRKPSLVRFADPHADVVDPDGPQPEVLVGEIKELRPAIIDILGLDFADFCQCVVLPQGQFARFLSATSKERQRILLKLLGADHYEGIGRAAGSRAKGAEERITVLAEQLQGLADATPEADAAARERARELDALQTRVEELVPKIEEARAAAAETRLREQARRNDADALLGLTPPDEIADLQQELDDARTALATAQEAATQARTALDAATDALRAGPSRAAVEKAQHDYNERDTVQGRHDPAEAMVAASNEEQAAAEVALTESTTATADARIALAEAATRHAAVRQRGVELARVRDRLALIRPPAGLDELTAQASELEENLAQARQQLTDVETRRDQAQGALTAAGRTEDLDRAAAELDALHETAADLADAHSELAGATGELDAALAAEKLARDSLTTAEAARDQARERAGAAHLRAALEVGHACPVCEQQVASLPPPLGDGTVAAADEAVAAARSAHAAANGQVQAASHSEQQWRGSIGVLDDRRAGADSRLASLLPTQPAGAERDNAADRAYVEQQRTALAALSAAHDEVGRAVDEARHQLESLTAAATSVHTEMGSHRDRLQQVLGTVRELDPPVVDPARLGPAWAALAEWAITRGDAVETELDVVATTIAELASAEQEATGAVTAAEHMQRAASEAHLSAVRRATGAAAELKAIGERLAQLEAQLADAPPRDQLPALLDECMRLEQEADRCTTEERRLRAEAADYVTAVRRADARAVEQRTALVGARDGVHRLSPPAVDTADLVASWTALSTWAAGLSSTLTAEADAAAIEADGHEQAHRERVAELGGLLGDHELELELDEPARATTVVAVAAARARSDAEAIAKQLADAEKTRDRIDQEREQQQVSATLAGLMRANRFPQWLADSALDSLVAGASDSLRKLSGDQFDLTHDRGEFFVIDHADADLTRSVKTLSGGETFQASLALALALSDHLAGMGGSTKLESIFLDEGFGTLDPDALETVAVTLESLAQGERTVGVITHVGELADRAPVRYRVHRDSHGSHVDRETL